MFILDRRNLLALGSAGAATAMASRLSRAAAADTKVFTADEAGVMVDSTVIVGEKSAVVIDAQFTVANAKALADVIQATGRKVETILVTHYHPDHLLGLSVLLERFPEAKPLTHPKVLEMINKASAPTLKVLSEHAPQGVFTDKLIVPDVLTRDHLLLEGERIDILDPMHGDTEFVTPVHIPSLNTLIAADVGYTDTHLWLEENITPDQIGKWRESTTKLEAIGAKTVIPGHRKPESRSDNSIFAYTRAYLDSWEKALLTSKSTDELKAVLVKEHPDAGFAFALERSVAAIYGK
ncbi:MBL fold metallo-hydrolase [Mesorhizobium sp. M8A.F.Ca.ET.202.01.1.1]|nr:MBL fold metallo-hydrolase [Mesorhizobium sp. M8A.F.Ca.ET.197.01.1.1]TGR32500.1 MBL fold metallo-hydrolase [Mesorhizobium sp. M8A.F.Ca.ET.202.01.1.1]TGR43681.1 MBL fold metallo-hydrolase [bacterium M00.F.Ca.ET.199.01.1.1]TGR53048.1 MBL fold metallo-hydrolase [Mesorhizobium sp. M8A.F.Ca.ET.198.01.1.1]TGU40379.1 MBL fold metallo-hydrolase [bacterium M00.F.Ca.ET.156.01.1.1]TGV86892.1 MBL fold metallo-hydrolase [Mesorhizobium sp. M00.F.Ca.ET.149.01.1.1]